MERRSSADVKAHLSEVVDHAEHRGKKVIILRHGKPAAAIVPVTSVREHRQRAPHTISLVEAQGRLDDLAAKLAGDPTFSAVADLLEGRR
jgi:prevent-host-death family protein